MKGTKKGTKLGKWSEERKARWMAGRWPGKKERPVDVAPESAEAGVEITEG